jgi:hypothetical protein
VIAIVECPSISLATFRRLIESLDGTIVKAQMTLTFRRGRQVVVKDLEVPVECLQQGTYVAQLRALTNNGTLRPAIPEQPFEIE